jgi:PKD repeat protein
MEQYILKAFGLCAGLLFGCTSFVAAQDCCVIDAIDPHLSYESASPCIPMEVQLTNTTLEPSCDALSFTWAVQGGDFEWSNGSGPNDENPQVVLFDATNYSISLSISAGSDGDCVFESNQVVVSSEAAPQVFMNATTDSLCIGETWSGQVLINPGNSVLSDFGWTLNGTLVGPESPAPLNQLLSEPGDHLFAVFAENACGVNQEEFLVYAAPEPVVEVFHPFFNCDFSEVDITASGADVYQWSSTAFEVSDGDPSDSMATFLMNGPIVGSVIGSVDYGSFSCTSSNVFNVNAFWAPTIDIAGDSLVCEGQLVDLSAEVNYFAGYTVEWMSEEASSQGDFFSISTEESQLDSIEVMAVVTSDGLLCTDTALWTVYVQELPVVEAGVPLEVCNQPFDIALDSGLPEGGVWSGLGVVSPQGVFNPSDLDLGESAMVYEYTDDLGCVNADTLLVSVGLPVPVEAGLDLSICASLETFSLEGLASPLGGTWSGLGVFGASADSVDLSLLGTGEHTLVYSLGEESCIASDMIQLTILPSPLMWIEFPDGVVCDGDYVELTAEPVGGNSSDYSIEWSSNMEVSDSDSSLASILVNNPVQVSATAIDALGCFSSLDLTIQPFPVTSVSMPASFTECSQDVEVFLPEAFPLEGSWSGAGVIHEELGVFNPSEAGVGASFLTYSIINSFGCESTDSVLVDVIASELLQLAMDTTICSNAPVLELENLDASLDVVWSGQSDIANGALNDAENGLVNPQLLTVGLHTYVASAGTGSCLVSDELVVEVKALPLIDLASEASFCPFNNAVELDVPNPSGGIWLGDGVLDPILGTFDSNQEPGLFDLAYVFTDSESGCADTVVHQVVLLDRPVAQFEAEDLSCQNALWLFEDASIDATEITWIIDEVVQENVTNAFLFPDLGIVEVQLFAMNAAGCSDSTSLDVEVIAPPLAQISSSLTSGCAPLDIEFLNESDASMASFSWEIDGTSFADTTPPLQTFDQGEDLAIYSAVLTVSNVCGMSSDSLEIEVYPKPQVSFVLLQDSACSPFTPEWINTSVGNPDVLNWNFGNGESASGWNPNAPVYIVADEAMAFDITLSASNACGVDSTSAMLWVDPNTALASFEPSTQMGCAPLSFTATDSSIDATEMTFDFDNGEVSSDSLATTIFDHAGSYEVTQYITNGCSFDTALAIIEVFEAPEFQWVVESTELCSEEVGVFSIEDSTSADVQWMVDGTEVETGFELQQAWDEVGTHWIQVEITAESMTCVQSDSVEVTVLPVPTIDITAAALAGCSPLLVEFENTSTGGVEWSWDFADSDAVSNLEAPAHLFLNESTEVASFDVLVTGTSADLCMASETIQVEVFPRPQIAFSTDELSACGNPANVQTINETQGAVNFTWMLDGNVGSTMFAPSIEVEGLGAHSIELLAVSALGCESMADQLFTVYPNPVPSLALDSEMGCQPVTLYLNDESVGAESAIVQIGLNGEAIFEGPVTDEPIILSDAGMHSIQLEVISIDGCVQTLELPQAVDVWPVPDVSFLADPYAGTPDAPHPLNSSWNFWNETEMGTSAYWDFGDGSSSYEWDASHEFGAAGAYPVTLTVYNEFGCFDELTQNVEIEDVLQVYVPNAFTPPSGGYSDGVNDGWRPEVSDASLLDHYELSIFNRWGQVVWRTQDPSAYWVGSSEMGGSHFAADDVYTWVLEIQSTAIEGFSEVRQGHVTVFR